MTPFRAAPDYAHWARVAAMIQRAFAYMEPLLGHPARAASVTADRLAEAAADGSAILIEEDSQPVACLFTRPSRDFPDALYLGWLAVDDAHRGKGLARALIDRAETEARTAGYAALTLDTGRAIADLLRYFRTIGFEDVPGSGEIISFRKPLA